MANDLSYKYVVVPVLANAALLKAAPGLGDLDTYIKEVNKLLVANDIPVPDLKLVYEPIPNSSSTMIRKVKIERFQDTDDSHGTLDHTLINKVKTERCLDDSHGTLVIPLIKKMKTEKHQDESHGTLDFTLIKKVKTERCLDESNVTLKFPLIKKLKTEKCPNDKKAPHAALYVPVPSVSAYHEIKHSAINTPNFQPCKVTDCGPVPIATVYKISLDRFNAAHKLKDGVYALAEHDASCCLISETNPKYVIVECVRHQGETFHVCSCNEGIRKDELVKQQWHSSDMCMHSTEAARRWLYCDIAHKKNYMGIMHIKPVRKYNKSLKGVYSEVTSTYSILYTSKKIVECLTCSFWTTKCEHTKAYNNHMNSSK